MKTHAQAVVIGGGLVGCSIAYHLTKLGWRDVVLLERSELTSGSTWHAAANIHGLHDVNNVSRLQYYTMRLYDELERETGQSCGIHRPGSLYLAQTPDREHQLRIQAAKARQYGVDFHELSFAEALELHPLLDLEGVRCVMVEVEGGHVDPSGVTHAYAAGARAKGAEIHRFTPVLETNPVVGGEWDVVTPAGTVRTGVVVNAAGLWAREVGRLAGLELPLTVMEHQYFVTETIPEIAALDRELPSVADRDAEYYLRQEGKGLLVGAYERDGRFFAEGGMPGDFGHELLPDDLERIEENVMRACARVPALAEAGVKRVINGPMIWSPDSAALLGPVPGLPGYHVCCGIIPGFSQSGGLGLTLAQWIVEGESELDMFAWDVARFGEWAGGGFARARALDCYSHRFKIHFPYEERDAGRPVRTRPVYEAQKAAGAVFGLNDGWEHALWFAANGREPVDSYGFERQPWHAAVGEECRALREGVGLIDVSSFGKWEIAGHGAGEWLERVLANRMPEVGRACLAPMLGLRGGIAGDFTVSRLEEERYLMIGSALAQRYHRRYLDMVPRPNGTTVRSLTDSLVGFNVAGPRAREVLARLTNADVSNEAFRFMRCREMQVAGCAATVIRVSFSGDLGYEIYVEEGAQGALHEALLAAGADLGIRQVGSRSLLSLRVEKGYGSWGREFSPECWPHEVGLDRFVRTDKPEFIGRDAWLRVRERPPRELLTTLEVQTEHADPVGGEPVFDDAGAPIGRVSSGAYGHSVAASIALAFLEPEHVVPGREVEVAILGRPHAARVLAEPPFDPRGERLRA